MVLSRRGTQCLVLREGTIFSAPPSTRKSVEVVAARGRALLRADGVASVAVGVAVVPLTPQVALVGEAIPPEFDGTCDAPERRHLQEAFVRQSQACNATNAF